MNHPSPIHDLLERLDPERRYEFEERAGTIEFDAELPRDHAELLALADLLRTHPAALIGVTPLLIKSRGFTELLLTTDLDLVRSRFVVVDTFDLSQMVQRQFGGIAFLRRCLDRV